MLYYMFRGWILVSLSCVLLSPSAHATTLPSPTTSASSPRRAYAQQSLTTPPPSIPHNVDLRKRKVAPNSVCGWSQYPNGDWTTWPVGAPYYCAGTILPDGSAYVYSSDAEAGSQYYVYTTAVGHWDTKKKCPTGRSTTCCSGNNNIVQTYYFATGSYTLTTWWCGSTKLTQTWVPRTNLLDARDFSTSLAQAKASAAANSNDLSPAAKAGIGVGVAGAVGVVVLLGVIFFFWRRHHNRTKKKIPDADSQSSFGLNNPHYDPRTPYNNPSIPYADSVAYYYQQPNMHPPPAWPTPPPEAIRMQELQGDARNAERQELEAGPKTWRSLRGKKEEQRQELSADTG